MLKVFLIMLILCCSVNSYQLTLQILQHQQHSSDPQLHNLGDQFRGLESVFSKIPKVGYFTDKNINIPIVIAQFEQAQYHLAPTILVLNQTNYPIVIFDCSSPAIAMQKIKEVGLQPVKINKFGIIIAVNPKLQTSTP